MKGLIPARAGNTQPVTATGATVGAHPRSRGEHRSKHRSASPRPGSSPLARGTLQACTKHTSQLGLIPARAGNTVYFSRAETRRWAHPRSRGEHSIGHGTWMFARGSSPLARGTQRRIPPPHRRPGLIPARAGNTAWLQASTPWSEAHPRSRGEHRGPCR